MKEHKYFVSYSYERGFGNCVVVRDAVWDDDAAVEVGRQLEEERDDITGVVVVLFYREM